MITTLRRSTIALLASSLLLTIGRGATLPFMTIYLTRRFQLEVDVIGYALSLALVVGVLFSMGFGILADRFDKKRYMVWSVLVFILGFSAIPLVNNALLVVIFFALINCAYSVFSTVLKAWFADRLTAEKKARIFSLNYTILNIGWTVGPPIGTLLVMHSINLPFWLAAACAAFPLVFIQLFLQRDDAAAAQPGAAPWSPSVLLRDRALLWFTCSVVLPVNAAVVVALQYAVGRRLSARNIRPLMTFGTVCFVIGLVGFMFSGASLWAWGISAAIFTLGEVIYAPGEYMLIDHIAPPGMKASYFSAQSLGWLGAAFNPMLTGLILTHLPHWSLFVILIVAIVAAWLMIFRGINARPWQPDSPLANA
ncbi:MFS transporter [Klebsiella pneumoniae]|uniref:MFS transporter n=1 Tax=Klebsiella pneumoniae TaxID=573 RepID=UPI000B40F8C6|nr:MFS transporter [Klebsiella pneumoniae]RNU93816.1 MFS transporter [Klebsiella pneumoniae]